MWWKWNGWNGRRLAHPPWTDLIILIIFFCQLPPLPSKEGEAPINTRPPNSPVQQCSLSLLLGILMFFTYCLERLPGHWGDHCTADIHAETDHSPCHVQNTNGLTRYLETFHFRIYSRWTAELDWDFLDSLAPHCNAEKKAQTIHNLPCSHEWLVCMGGFATRLGTMNTLTVTV